MKGVGYLISIVSVVLIGIASWKNVSQDPILRLCLVGGIATSILGMILRWMSHGRDARARS